MATLDSWLNQAVRHLSKDSAEIVRREIQEHYDAAREAALHSGIDPEQAELMAVQSLGDPRVANRQYRKVLLTSSEAKILREAKAESQMICSTGWIKWTLMSAPGILLLISAISLAMHLPSLARGVLVVGALMAIFFIAPFLPIYTSTRGLIFRVIKWCMMFVCVFVLFGADTRNEVWLASCWFFPMFYIEWKRTMIRRKLPIGQWPRHLYL